MVSWIIRLNYSSTWHTLCMYLTSTLTLMLRMILGVLDFILEVMSSCGLLGKSKELVGSISLARSNNPSCCTCTRFSTCRSTVDPLHGCLCNRVKHHCTQGCWQEWTKHVVGQSNYAAPVHLTKTVNKCSKSVQTNCRTLKVHKSVKLVKMWTPKLVKV